MDEAWRQSGETVLQAVASGEDSAQGALERSLRRVEEVDSDVGAFLELWRPSAEELAARVDSSIAAGEEAGPLAGLPVALKDNLSYEGHAITCGSKILDGYRAPYTATAVQRLLDAGAVPIGRANMDEFAMGSSCENSALQQTRNPWHLDRVPGGSSGGSAAAVAASTVPVALGSDTGGSIRQPAAFCGLVGLKPTYGRVSRFGLVAFASSLDQIGPLSRTVRDSARVLGAIAGPDPADSTASERPVDDYLATIEDGANGLRVGVIQECEIGKLSPEVRAGFEHGLDALERGGAEIVEVSIPYLGASVAAYYVLANSEASANLSRFDGSRYGHRARSGGSLQEMYRASRSEGFGAEVKRRIILGTFALSSGYYDAYYGKAVQVARKLAGQFAQAFASVDLLVTPTAPSAAFRLGELQDDPLAMYLSDVFTTPASLVGLPALSVPTGLDSEGLPLGLQILGAHFDEARVLRLGRTLERLVDFEHHPTFRQL